MIMFLYRNVWAAMKKMSSFKKCCYFVRKSPVLTKLLRKHISSTSCVIYCELLLSYSSQASNQSTAPDILTESVARCTEDLACKNHGVLLSTTHLVVPIEQCK